MKKLLVILLGAALISCSNEKQENLNESENVLISNDLEIPVLSIAEFDYKAGDFVNKEVQVKGIVDHVCKHGGKKLLLVNDDGDIHVTTDDDRFSDELIGEEITVNGIVEEFRVDEEYCLQMEEDAIKNHSEGESDDELFERKKQSIQSYRDSMKTAGVDHLSYYSLVYVSMKLDESVEIPQ